MTRDQLESTIARMINDKIVVMHETRLGGLIDPETIHVEGVSEAAGAIVKELGRLALADRIRGSARE
jgi:hypothetical protein